MNLLEHACLAISVTLEPTVPLPLNHLMQIFAQKDFIARQAQLHPSPAHQAHLTQPPDDRVWMSVPTVHQGSIVPTTIRLLLQISVKLVRKLKCHNNFLFNHKKNAILFAGYFRFLYHNSDVIFFSQIKISLHLICIEYITDFKSLRKIKKEIKKNVGIIWVLISENVLFQDTTVQAKLI